MHRVWQPVSVRTGSPDVHILFAILITKNTITICLGHSFLTTDWVVKLGPSSFGEQNLYQYAVVTDNMQIQLYVLARDVEIFKNQYDKEVLSWLAENGFTRIYNKPVAIVQNEKCLYPDKKSLYQSLGEFLEQK